VSSCLTYSRSDLRPALPLLVLLCLHGSAGCQNVQKSPGEISNRFTASTDELTRRGSLQKEEINWSPTLYYGGMRFRFQLPTGNEEVDPVFGHSDRKDFVEVKNVRVYRDRNRFKIGTSIFRWDTDSIIWVYTPPTEDLPFWRQQGLLEITCFGDDSDPVVEEQGPDGSFVWTYKNARVTLAADGLVTYTYRGSETPVAGNRHLILGPQGEMLGKQNR